MVHLNKHEHVEILLVVQEPATEVFNPDSVVLKWRRINLKKSEHVAKSYIKNNLNVDIEESVFNRIYRIGPKINKNGKTFQQIIVKFKSFVPRTKVCRARKHKADIAIYLDLTKRHYLLLKDAHDKTKDGASVNFASVDINWSIPWKNFRDYYRKFNN